MIKKFKTFEDARRDLWELNPDAEYYARVRRFYELASGIVKYNAKSGVFKFKTIQEANQHRADLSKE